MRRPDSIKHTVIYVVFPFNIDEAQEIMLQLSRHFSYIAPNRIHIGDVKEDGSEFVLRIPFDGELSDTGWRGLDARVSQMGGSLVSYFKGPDPAGSSKRGREDLPKPVGLAARTISEAAVRLLPKDAQARYTQDFKQELLEEHGIVRLATALGMLRTAPRLRQSLRRAARLARNVA